jgi:hypothetical protein
VAGGAALGHIAGRPKPFNELAFNTDLYKHVYDVFGEGHLAPKTPGPEALREMQKYIGGKFNRTDHQMAISEPIEGEFANHLQDDIGAQVRFLGNHPDWERRYADLVTGPLARGDLSGAEYGKYISRIRQAADDLARSAKGQTGTDTDALAMASALRKSIDEIEQRATELVPGAKAARAQARKAYKIWATIDDAAPRSKGDSALMNISPIQCGGEPSKLVSKRKRHRNRLLSWERLYEASGMSAHMRLLRLPRTNWDCLGGTVLA